MGAVSAGRRGRCTLLVTVLTDPENLTGHTAIVNAYRFFERKISALRDAGELQSRSGSPRRLATAWRWSS